MEMRLPPLKLKIMLESNPPKSIILVRRLALTQESNWSFSLLDPVFFTSEPQGLAATTNNNNYHWIIYVCMSIHVYIYVYISIHICIEREREREISEALRLTPRQRFRRLASRVRCILGRDERTPEKAERRRTLGKGSGRRSDRTGCLRYVSCLRSPQGDLKQETYRKVVLWSDDHLHRRLHLPPVARPLRLLDHEVDPLPELPGLWSTAVFLLEIPEISIESLDKSRISRWSLEVITTILRCFRSKPRPGNQIHKSEVRKWFAWTPWPVQCCGLRRRGWVKSCTPKRLRESATSPTYL